MIEYFILLSLLIIVYFGVKWGFRVLVLLILSKGLKSQLEEHKKDIEKKKEEWRAKHGRGI